MLLKLDFELLRLIFLHLEVRDIINLYETCRHLNGFFLIEAGHRDSIIPKIKLKNLVAVAVVQNLGRLEIVTYNYTLLGSQAIPNVLRFSKRQAEHLRRQICSKDYFGYKTDLVGGDGLIYYDDDIAYIRPPQNVFPSGRLRVDLSINTTLLRRLLQEYKTTSEDPHSERPIIYVFGDRSVLRTCRYKLVGY